MKIILALVLGLSVIARADVQGELPSGIKNLCSQGDCTENFAAIAKAYDAIQSLRLPTVRSVYQGECEFKGPLRFGDTAEIEVSVTRLGAKSITFRYRVWRAADDGRERTLSAEGLVVCAVVDLAKFVAIPVPERVVQLLADLVEP